MKPFREFSALCILVLISVTLTAQNDNCNIKKTYPVRRGSTLRLSNKYGDVNIITGKNDSLLICSTITIMQENEDLLMKSKNLVSINIDKLKDTVSVATVYDKKFFSDSFREGRKNFSVDYFITMPVYMDLKIVNEFGNLLIDELSGTLNVRLSQGMLSAKKLTRGNDKPINAIFVDHGKVSIDEANWMTVTVLNCPSVNIEKARALMMTSVISKIRIGEINSLVSNSKSDIYNINSVNNIVSESTYTEYEIGRLDGQLRSKAIYGSISVADLNKGFSSIDIASSQSLITLSTGQGVSFSANVNATDAMVAFPAAKYPLIKRTENNFSTALNGSVGPDKNTNSTIKISATGGKVSIQ